jgi:hypothetical protein
MLDMDIGTRKDHTPEHVVLRLATADWMLNESKDVADICCSEKGLRTRPA